MQDRPTIVVPGRMSEFVRERLPDHFLPVFLDAADPALVTADLGPRVSGIAIQGKLPSGFVDAFPNLEIIASFGVGYDGVDAAHAAGRGIVVTNTPDVLTEEVADTTIGLLINTLRRLPAAEQWLRQGRWAKVGHLAISPLTVRGRTVGLYGMGRIGRTHQGVPKNVRCSLATAVLTSFSGTRQVRLTPKFVCSGVCL